MANAGVAKERVGGAAMVDELSSWFSQAIMTSLRSTPKFS